MKVFVTPASHDHDCPYCGHHHSFGIARYTLPITILCGPPTGCGKSYQLEECGSLDDDLLKITNDFIDGYTDRCFPEYCTKPSCPCYDEAVKKNGGEDIKYGYPCLGNKKLIREAMKDFGEPDSAEDNSYTGQIARLKAEKEELVKALNELGEDHTKICLELVKTKNLLDQSKPLSVMDEAYGLLSEIKKYFNEPLWAQEKDLESGKDNESYLYDELIPRIQDLLSEIKSK